MFEAEVDQEGKKLLRERVGKTIYLLHFYAGVVLYFVFLCFFRFTGAKNPYFPLTEASKAMTPFIC